MSVQRSSSGFLIIAVEHDAVQERHHVALDHIGAPVEEQPPGVGDFLRELRAAGQRILADLGDLAGRVQQRVEVGQFGTGHRLADTVLHLQCHAAPAVGLRPHDKRPALACRARRASWPRCSGNAPSRSWPCR